MVQFLKQQITKYHKKSYYSSPNFVGNCDILYTNSTLQYIKDEEIFHPWLLKTPWPLTNSQLRDIHTTVFELQQYFSPTLSEFYHDWYKVMGGRKMFPIFKYVNNSYGVNVIMESFCLKTPDNPHNLCPNS
jgi:hypothetical protein